MTDLERDWDDLPVGTVPLDAILREARRESARTRKHRPEARLRRSLLGVATVAGIAAAFVAGTLVTTPDGGSPASPPGAAAPNAPNELAPGVVPAAFQGELEAPKSCDDLLATYVDAGVDLVSAYGWDSPYLRRDYATSAGVRLDRGNVVLGELTRVPAAYANSTADSLNQAKTSTVTSSETGTNVQEVGVDEPDSVKTNGTILVRLQEHTLTTYDVSGSAVKETGSLDLGDFHDGEILLAGDTVVAIGDDGTRSRNVSYGYYLGGYDAAPQTRVVTIDVADPSAPKTVQTLDYTAATVTARQHGDAVRLVLSAGLPDLDFVEPGRGRGSARTALGANRATVEASTLDDWLPRVSIDGAAPEQFLACDRVAIPRAEIGLATMAVVGFSAGTPVAEAGDLSALGLAGNAPLAYESVDHLYLAASPPTNFGSFGCIGRCFQPTFDGTTDDGTTHVYDFALDGASASYVGAGEVEGTVADRWAMDEYDGVLRLAVGPSSETGRFNSIVTLRADGDRLDEIGRLDRIGVGEDLKSVRWFDTLALVVTFRQIDPFFAVDLTDQQDPTLIGELKLPGFSSYLHPLGGMRVVGMGEGPQGSTGGRRWGAQAGLFDVTDLTKPGRISTVEYGGGTRALAGDDPRQFTWLPGTRTVLTVIQRGRVGYVSSMHVGGGRLANTMTQVEYGRDVSEVRLVPLPDDKVALVTGDDVEFFE